ncbi:MAG TPA: hypothetical protein VFA35_00785, partial [Burkholderiaceae bacterium]|nr:hypothetical protein [Burkholderiaceae bacterium]
MAPFERGAQGLVPAQGDACASGQQAKALVEALPHAVDAEQGHAPGAELDRERNAVEPAADLDHAGDVLRRERKAVDERACAGNEELHGTGGCGRVEAGCISPVARNGQRAEPVHVLVGMAQQLLARRQHVDAGRAAAQQRHEGVDGLEHVLAVVEDQQQALCGERLQRMLEARRRIADRDAERTRDRGRDQRRLDQRRELDQAHAVRERADVLAGRDRGEPGLADPRGADDRDEAALANALAECVDIVLPAEQLFDLGGRHCRSDAFARRGPVGLGRCRTLARHREAIAPPGNGGDRLRPEQLAQGGDLHLQVVFLDDEARPRQIEELLLGDQLAGAFGERHEHVERACADRDRSAADNEAALHGLQHEGIEAEVVGGHARSGASRRQRVCAIGTGCSNCQAPAGLARAPRDDG